MQPKASAPHTAPVGLGAAGSSRRAAVGPWVPQPCRTQRHRLCSHHLKTTLSHSATSPTHSTATPTLRSRK